MKTPLAKKIILAFILLVAAVLRLWNIASYFPHFWDEAKYLAEVEGLTSHFSVNAGAFAFLKLGYTLIGSAHYAQVVTAIFGVLTVFGLYLLGKSLPIKRETTAWLGLLMAGQAALMPYFVRYSQHAFATIFALCFFVFALYFYLVRLQYPPVRNKRTQNNYLRLSLAAVGCLAMVPACSFKFLLPTLILFVVWEGLLFRVRTTKGKDSRAGRNFIIVGIAGAILFVSLPLLLSTIAGYTGWLERAIALSKSHAAIQTMRLAGNFLYPVHLFHFCGILFTACVIIGGLLLLEEPKPRERPSSGGAAGLLMVIGFAVYVLFFGLFSHLQAARLYALTLPFLVFASSICLWRLWYLKSWLGRLACPVATTLVLFSLGLGSYNYLSRSSNLMTASKEIMQHIVAGRVIRTNATSQVAYFLYNSYDKTVSYKVRALTDQRNVGLDPENPPLIVIQDGVDLATEMATLDKYDRPGNLDLNQLLALEQSFYAMTNPDDLIFAATDEFYTSPDYYLEDIYTWDGYHQLNERLAEARDSVLVYLVDPGRYKP